MDLKELESGVDPKKHWYYQFIKHEQHPISWYTLFGNNILLF